MSGIRLSLIWLSRLASEPARANESIVFGSEISSSSSSAGVSPLCFFCQPSSSCLANRLAKRRGLRRDHHPMPTTAVAVSHSPDAPPCRHGPCYTACIIYIRTNSRPQGREPCKRPARRGSSRASGGGGAGAAAPETTRQTRWRSRRHSPWPIAAFAAHPGGPRRAGGSVEVAQPATGGRRDRPRDPRPGRADRRPYTPAGRHRRRRAPRAPMSGRSHGGGARGSRRREAERRRRAGTDEAARAAAPVSSGTLGGR